jgi:hypothetical protein
VADLRGEPDVSAARQLDDDRIEDPGKPLPAGRSVPGAEHGVIVAEELVKTDPGEVHAVRGISFSVAAGEMAALSLAVTCGYAVVATAAAMRIFARQGIQQSGSGP